MDVARGGPNGVGNSDMRSRAVFWFSLLIGAGCVAPADPSDHVASEERAIIGGVLSTDTDFPSAGVILGRGNFSGMDFGLMICTGTLIAPDVVMTAGHCTID